MQLERKAAHDAKMQKAEEARNLNISKVRRRAREEDEVRSSSSWHPFWETLPEDTEDRQQEAESSAADRQISDQQDLSL